MIDLSGGQPPWPARLRRRWAECAAAAAETDALWREPAPAGDDLLREQLAAWLGLDSERLTITASLRAAALTYARRFDRVVVERPTYQGVPLALGGHRAVVTAASWDELLASEPDAGTVLWLTSPARNPDGASLCPATVAALAELARRGVRVVVNATYARYAGGPTVVPGADLVGSLHKLVGVGARVGWVHSASYFDEAVPELLGTTPSRVWQRAWGLFLRDGGAEALDEAVITPAVRAAHAYRERLRVAHGWRTPGFAGPNALLALRPGVAEEAALDRFAELGFRLCGGRHFDCLTPALRVTFLGVAERDAAAFADAVATCALVAQDRVAVAEGAR